MMVVLSFVSHVRRFMADLRGGSATVYLISEELRFTGIQYNILGSGFRMFVLGRVLSRHRCRDRVFGQRRHNRIALVVWMNAVVA